MVEQTAIFTFSDDAEEIPRMRQFVSLWLRAAPLQESDQADFLLAVTEAINNACQHAGPRGHEVQISCSRSDDRVSVSVADHGGGFSPELIASQHRPPVDQTDGGGLFLMRQLVDGVTVTPTRGGTKVSLVRDATS